MIPVQLFDPTLGSEFAERALETSKSAILGTERKQTLARLSNPKWH
jgi:hypothetical protein